MANTFKSAATGSRTALTTMYTCPSATSAVVHAIYLSNVDGTNDATVSVAISGSANFQTRRFILKTVDVPAGIITPLIASIVAASLIPPLVALSFKYLKSDL